MSCSEKPNNGKETMNEPQLTAEMERKAEEVFEHYNGDGYANPCPRIPCDCQVKEYKHFLATVLEEQRMKTEVETGIHAFGVTMEEIAKARADERKRCISIVENFIDHILENNTGSLEELLNQLKEEE